MIVTNIMIFLCKVKVCSNGNNVLDMFYHCLSVSSLGVSTYDVHGIKQSGCSNQECSIGGKDSKACARQWISSYLFLFCLGRETQGQCLRQNMLRARAGH